MCFVGAPDKKGRVLPNNQVHKKGIITESSPLHQLLRLFHQQNYHEINIRQGKITTAIYCRG